MRESQPRPVWWLPSLGLFLVLAIELSLFSSPDRLFSDPGACRHLRTAEYILATHQVPRADPLSFTHGGEAWIDYEWAFEATLGELHRLGGLGLICAFCTAVFAATNLVVYRTLLQSGFSLSVIMVVTGLVFLSLHMHLSARPVLFSYLFMALLVEVWQRRRQPLRRDWLSLPVIFAAWANIHAGWAAGLAFLSLATLGRIIDRWRGRLDGEEAPVIPWLGMIALCLAATCLNPWGWHLHPRIFAFATSYKSFALWEEYSQPDFREPSMLAIVLLCFLAILLAARATSRSPRWRWEMIIPAFYFLDQGLKFQRHVLFLVEIIAVPLARDLEVLLHGKWWPGLRERAQLFQEQQRLAGGDVPLSFLVMIIAGGIFLMTPAAGKLPVGRSITPGLVKFLSDHPDRGKRPLVTTWTAGPLLWNLRPTFKVSFDDRGDFYGDAVVYSYVGLYNCGPGWRDTLAKGNYDAAILDNYLNLSHELPFLAPWKLVYRDEKTSVFWRPPQGTLPMPAAKPSLSPEALR